MKLVASLDQKCEVEAKRCSRVQMFEFEKPVCG